MSFANLYSNGFRGLSSRQVRLVINNHRSPCEIQVLLEAKPRRVDRTMSEHGRSPLDPCRGDGDSGEMTAAVLIPLLNWAKAAHPVATDLGTRGTANGAQLQTTPHHALPQRHAPTRDQATVPRSAETRDAKPNSPEVEAAEKEGQTRKKGERGRMKEVGRRAPSIRAPDTTGVDDSAGRKGRGGLSTSKEGIEH
ncbi:hypothetical protein Hypma_005504 [Hypsizygus marmoreus]|uniref:Uncharacterized protein n=1 Tax=Hypsizygus marmoreus TaxID=39966 RepID=A0A369IZ31_HYPMA|nr:hypothetical protein Hypma_005504 [Hypsizygus marmoreus]